jgi:hypothetical protein
MTLAAVFFAATVAGFLVNRHVANKFANVHHVNPLLYLLAKAPYNFVKNILGIRIWTNTLIHTQGEHPIVKWPLPARFRVGEITEVGIGWISVFYPAEWILSIIAAFGAALTVLVHASMKAGKSIVPARAWWPVRLFRGFASLTRGQSIMMRIAVVYGVVSLIIVPLLGADIYRYVYYAWPALWLFAPVILVRRYELTGAANRATVALLLIAHQALCWMCVVQGSIALDARNTLLLLVIAIALQVCCWRCLDRLAVD